MTTPDKTARDEMAREYCIKDAGDVYPDQLYAFQAGYDARDREVRELRRELESALERNQPNADAVKEYQGQALKLEIEVDALKAEVARLKEVLAVTDQAWKSKTEMLGEAHAENARLREALEKIAADKDSFELRDIHTDIARAALDEVGE